MPQTSELSSLPTELLLHITEYLSTPDLSCLSRVSRHIHWRLFYHMLDSAIAERSGSRGRKQCLVGLFSHALKHDSTNILQYLIYLQINLNEPILTHRLRLPINFSLLHVALLADAPRVAVHLMKSGTDLSPVLEDYPDLTTLYRTLPRTSSRNSQKLDAALRVACGYAFPRITGFLLTKGANPNTTSAYGTAAIHTAVMRRPPWREYLIVGNLLSLQAPKYGLHWESMLLRTVSTLLDYGADVHIQTCTARTHKCGPSCWRSIDCDNPGQTALHLAAASGMIAVISRLLDAGADPTLPNKLGFTALYTALAQGHIETARLILNGCNLPTNPIVCLHERITALHVACRFSFPQMVAELLSRGADANTIDCHGRTPLYYVLSWARLDREEEVVLTLRHLVSFDAGFDMTRYDSTVQQLAEEHAFKSVRDMFLNPKERALSRYARRNLSSHDSSPREEARTGNHCRVTGPESRDHAGVDRSERVTEGLKACTSVSDRDVVKAVVPEQFPRLIAKTNSNSTPIATSAADVWSEQAVAKLVKGYQACRQSPKHTSRSQQSTEDFHAPKKFDRFNEERTMPARINTEAMQFWSNRTGRIAGVVGGTVMNSSKGTERPSGGMIGTKTCRNQNRKRWTKLNL